MIQVTIKEYGIRLSVKFHTFFAFLGKNAKGDTNE